QPWLCAARFASQADLACLQQRLDRAGEFRPILGQLRGTYGKHVHLCPADDEPEVLEEPADLVLEISLDLNQHWSGGEEGFDRVTIEVFDAAYAVQQVLVAFGFSYCRRPAGAL